MREFTDKDMLTDALVTQKFLTDAYNRHAGECSVKRAKDKMMKILEEEHDLQFEIFEAMQKNSWYEVPMAEEKRVEETFNKFQNSQPQK